MSRCGFKILLKETVKFLAGSHLCESFAALHHSTSRYRRQQLRHCWEHWAAKCVKIYILKTQALYLSCAACCRWPCFGRRVGRDDPQRSLLTPNILWYCNSQSLSRCPKRGFIAYWREHTTKDTLLTRAKRIFNNSCAVPGRVHAHSFEIRDYLKSGFMAWAQAPALSLSAWGGCCSLPNLAVATSHPESEGCQFSMTFLPCPRQPRFTRGVHNNSFTQWRNWHRDTLHLTVGCGFLIWPGKEGRLMKPRQKKARDSMTVLPHDEAISRDGAVMGSGTSQKSLSVFAICSSLIR